MIMLKRQKRGWIQKKNMRFRDNVSSEGNLALAILFFTLF